MLFFSLYGFGSDSRGDLRIIFVNGCERFDWCE